ncbi:MAG: DNA cytosine methyltransferase [Deltaproteobacteria bacterium]|nr:DNA cytosine methyltransferase [Deltaproteobacteria bacterium]
MGAIKIVDLFAGAGGLSIGATAAGLEVGATVEIDPVACETLRANGRFHGSVIESDVALLSGHSLRRAAGVTRRDRLIVIGGAPCQPFSKAAYWTDEGKEAAFRRKRARGIRAVRPDAPSEVRPDPRRNLVAEFWRLVESSDADGFLFENVASIKHPRNIDLYRALLRRAVSAGFEVTEVEANSVNYGVAQTRARVIVLGAKKRAPVAPLATHVFDTPRSANQKRAVTAGEALDGFDKKKYFEPEEIISGRWASHLSEIPPGWNYKALTAWAGHPRPTFEAETRFWNFLLKLSPSRPSWTLAASPGPWTGPFHWNSRRLRTSEMAALQGFPRGYKFAGSRRERVRQIGNAVPPPMAKAMVSAIAEAL